MYDQSHEDHFQAAREKLDVLRDHFHEKDPLAEYMIGLVRLDVDRMYIAAKKEITALYEQLPDKR